MMNATTGQTPGRARSQAENRDPQALERDSDAIRADMDRTLEALERKFSPKEVVERSANYLREHGSELAHEVGDTVRRNPIPILLTATGLAWLTAAIIQERADRNESNNPADWDDDAESEDYLDEYVSGADERGSEERGRRVRATMRRARAAVSNTAHRLGDSVQANASRAQHTFGRFVQEQPLVVGMLALTAGALLGAALPVTEYERRAVGSGNGANRPSRPTERFSDTESEISGGGAGSV